MEAGRLIRESVFLKKKKEHVVSRTYKRDKFALVFVSEYVWAHMLDYKAM